MSDVGQANEARPMFMSVEHVDIMNARLAADPASNAATARMSRRHVLAYELADGPGGDTVWWQMRFDPASGVAFALTRPDAAADLTLVGDWREVIEDIIARDATAMRVKYVGNTDLLSTVGRAFAAAQQAAAVPVAFPDLKVK